MHEDEMVALARELRLLATNLNAYAMVRIAAIAARLDEAAREEDAFADYDAEMKALGL